MQTALENSTKMDLISLIQEQAQIMGEQDRVTEKQAQIIGKNRIDMANFKVRIAQLQRMVSVQKKEEFEGNKNQQSLPFAPTQEQAKQQ